MVAWVLRPDKYLGGHPTFWSVGGQHFIFCYHDALAISSRGTSGQDAFQRVSASSARGGHPASILYVVVPQAVRDSILSEGYRPSRRRCVPAARRWFGIAAASGGSHPLISGGAPLRALRLTTAGGTHLSKGDVGNLNAICVSHKAGEFATLSPWTGASQCTCAEVPQAGSAEFQSCVKATAARFVWHRGVACVHRARLGLYSGVAACECCDW